MADLAKIGIEIDSTAAKAGADQAVQAADKVTRSFDKMGSNVEKSTQSFRSLSPAAKQAANDFERMERQAARFAKVQQEGERNARLLTRAIAQEYARAQADIKERVARGFLSPQEAEKLGRQVGIAFDKGLTSVIDKQGAAGAFSGARGQATYVALANQFKNVDAASTKATGGLRTFASQLAQMAAANLGVSSRLGSLASSISFFGLGALTSAGIMAGIAGIGLLWDKLTKSAREAKERTDKLVESLVRARREASGETARQNESDLVANLERATTRVAREGMIRFTGSRFGTTDASKGTVSKAAIEDEKRANEALFQFYTERAEKFFESEDERVRKAKAAADEILRIERETQDQLRQLRDAEFSAKGDTAGAALARIDDQVAAADRLNAAEKERYETALLTVEALARQKKALDGMAGLLAQLNQAAARGSATGATGLQLEKSSQAPIRLSDQQRREMDAGFIDDLAKARQKEKDAALQQIRTTEQLRLAALNLVQGSDDLVERFAYTLSVIVQFRAQMEAMEAAINATTDATEKAKLEQQKLQQQIIGWAQIALSVVPQGAAGNVARAGIGGAAAGAQLGGLAGGVVGGALGIVGGLIGLGSKAREEARLMQEARKAWDEAFESFGLVGRLAGTQFAQQARNIKTEAERVFDELKAAFPDGRSSIRPSDLEDIVNQPERLRRVKEEAAKGDEYATRVLEIIEKYNTALAELARQREEELHYLGLDLDARQASLEGREDEAAAIRLQIDHERELAGLREQFGDALTPAIAAQVEYIQGLEREALAKEQATKAAEEAQRQADIGQDLAVRKLVATGDDKGADALRFQLEQERELREAVASGISDSNLALLQQVQALEAVALASAEAAAAEAKRKEQLAASQDLDVRFLRALGQGGAADDLEFRLGQERELQAAKDQGFTQEFIDQLTEVLRVEAAARGRVEEAAVAAESGARNASVKDITGLSEQTAVRIDSRLFTQTVILRQIEVNTRPNGQKSPTIYVNAQNPNQLTPAGYVAVGDRIQSNNLTTQNSANGVRPEW